MVVNQQIVLDGSFQFAGAAEGTTPNLFGGQGREEALDQINPRTAGGREVDVKARTLGQPVPDQRGLVSPVVVHNQMNAERGRNVGVDRVEKFAELHRAMAAM